MAELTIKRAYQPAGASDGTRVLVDALWPRGVSRERLGIDLWCREIAPSPALRRWFGHDPARWERFRERYAEELAERADVIDRLRRLTDDGTVTLVYAARDETHNNAVALKQIIEGTLQLPADAHGAGSVSKDKGEDHAEQT